MKKHVIYDASTKTVDVVEVPETLDEPLPDFEPTPTLDERVEKVEAEVATTQEVLDVLFGGV